MRKIIDKFRKKQEIELLELPKNFIYISTNEEFDQLMQVYGVGKWKTIMGEKATNFGYFGEDTGVTVKRGFCGGNLDDAEDSRLISVEEFLKKLNKWFGKYSPNRNSKKLFPEVE